ncbi:hypothetical protein BH09ACT12_BH09ACT12_15910 [soil metagenome]
MPNSKLITSATGSRSFDHYARLVRRFLRVPVALVTLVEADRQVFCGLVGLEGPYGEARETPLSHSFCQYVVADEKPLVISDARLDPRLADNLAIPDLNVVAYAGWPLRDAAGTTVGSLCAIDSTPRTWTQEDLDTLEDLANACSAELQGMWRQAEDGETLLRSIFESVNVAIAFYDTDEKLVIANALAERAAAAAGFRLDEPPYAGAQVRRADNATPIPLREQVVPLALRGELENHEMEWIGPPGQQFAIVATAQEVLNSDASVRGTLIAAHDVTELARSMNVKDEFITTVSHELRTPLTSIIGYLEILDEELDVDAGLVANALDTIRRNAARLLERVQQLLDTADRRRNLSMRPTDLDALANSVTRMFATEAHAAGVELSTSAGEAHWATIDAGQLGQALENLVSNAIKYIGTGRRVHITSETCGQSSRIAVTDDGRGMSPDEVTQACTTFWRSESALKDAKPGFGIGLTLVRDIVEAHHGSLDIASTPGSGTTATLTFPTSPESGADLASQAVPQDAYATSQL